MSKAAVDGVDRLVLVLLRFLAAGICGSDPP
jgi:hypothetical protein